MGSTNNQYPMGQLSVGPDQIDVPSDMRFRGTYGDSTQECMAAVLIALCSESGNRWTGLPVSIVRRRALQAQRQGCFPVDRVFVAGLRGLRQQGMIRVERMGTGKNAFSLVYPTEAILGPIQRYINA